MAAASEGARAQALPACSELEGRAIYAVGPSSFTPLIGEVASRLRETEDEADQLTIVYAQPGTCGALDAFDPQALEADRLLFGTGLYWDAGNSTSRLCALPEDGVAASLGLLPASTELCGADDELPNVGVRLGPVSTIHFIVPRDSSERAISAEAAYFLYRFGSAAEVAPWTDEAALAIANEASFNQRYIAGALGIAPDFEHGTQPDDVVGAVASGAPDATLGFTSGANAQANRDRVRTLAYRHFDQSCGYYPDSSASRFDKLNVRTGRYALWSALRLIAAVDAEGAFVDDAVARLIGYLTHAREAPPELPLLDVLIDGDYVPQCAMQVQRDGDYGALASFQPEAPCGCYFEARATGSSSCAACDDDDDCSSQSPTCRYGFCERP